MPSGQCYLKMHKQTFPFFITAGTWYFRGYDFLLVFAKKGVNFRSTLLLSHFGQVIFGCASNSLMERYTVNSLPQLLHLYSYAGIDTLLVRIS